MSHRGGLRSCCPEVSAARLPRKFSPLKTRVNLTSLLSLKPPGMSANCKALLT